MCINLTDWSFDISPVKQQHIAGYCTLVWITSSWKHRADILSPTGTVAFGSRALLDAMSNKLFCQLTDGEVPQEKLLVLSIQAGWDRRKRSPRHLQMRYDHLKNIYLTATGPLDNIGFSMKFFLLKIQNTHIFPAPAPKYLQLFQKHTEYIGPIINSWLENGIIDKVCPLSFSKYINFHEPHQQL